MDTSTFKTFKARAVDETPLGQVFVGTVKITIDFCDVNERSLSSNFILKDIVEVEELPTFNLFEDFPTDVQMPAFDLQSENAIQPSAQRTDDDVELTDIDIEDISSLAPSASSVPAYVPVDLINTVNEQDDTDTFGDVVIFEDCVFNLDERQEDALLEDVNAYENEFFPIRHPVARAGVQVNRKGEIILQSDDEEAMKTLRIRQMDQSFVKVAKRNNNLELISKENKSKMGPVYAFDIYRNGTWLKACDFHLPTEIIKTFRPQFLKEEIDVIFYDGDCTNCHLDNLVAKIEGNDMLKASPNNVVLSNEWTESKLWNGDILPNFFTSINGSIIHVNGETITPRSIGSAANCYTTNMHGMKFDARKVVWRAFTNEEPEYSESHYKVHIVNKTHSLSFDNLSITIESSTFDQWTKEDETWPWKRSSKGNVPMHLRVRGEKKAARKQKVAKAVRKPKVTRKHESVKTKGPETKPTRTRAQTSKVNNATKTSTSSFNKQSKAAAPIKKRVKLMSQAKFDELTLKVRMNLTSTKKDREAYEEQRVLRKLKKFLG